MGATNTFFAQADMRPGQRGPVNSCSEGRAQSVNGLVDGERGEQLKDEEMSS